MSTRTQAKACGHKIWINPINACSKVIATTPIVNARFSRIWFTHDARFDFIMDTPNEWEMTHERLQLMSIESFLYVTVGLLFCIRLGFVFRDWSHHFPVKPDPWDAEIAEKLKQPDCVPVCHHCFTPQEHDKWFCPECGASVGPYNNYLPYIHIFSEGEVLRNGVRSHVARNPLTVVGYLCFSTLEYLIFAPLYWYLLFRNLRREQTSQEGAPAAPQSREP